MKTPKAITKKIQKITRNGKVIMRKTGNNHFNAKDRGKKTRAKRNNSVMFEGQARSIRKALNA